jgi:hypothetical protein
MKVGRTWGAAAIVATALTLAHISIGPSLDASGPLLVLDHLYYVALVATLLAVCLVTGLLILRRLGLAEAPPLDRLVFGIGLGSGAIATLYLFLGAVGLLYPLVLAGTLVACAWVSVREVRGLPDLARGILRELGEGDGSRGLGVAAIIASAVAIFLLLALSVTPQVDWDSLLLHVRVPSQFLVEHRIHVPPDNLPSGFASLVHMLYVPLLAAGSTSGPAVLSAAFGVAVALTVFAVARHAFDEDVARLSVIGVWGCGIVLMVAVTPRIDVTLTYFVLLTHYALIRALPPKGATSETGAPKAAYFWLAAVLAGFMVSVKYQGFVYALALAPLVLVASRSRSQDVRARVGAVVAFGATAALVAAPWIAKNLILFKAPFAPMFTGPVVPPWIEALYGSRDFPIEGPAAFSGVVWQLIEPFNLRDFFLAPQRLTVEVEALFYYATPLLLALPLALIFLRNRLAAWLAGPALAFALVLLVYSPRTNLRYLIPSTVVLTVVSAAGGVETVRKLFADRRSRRLATGLFLAPLSFLPSAVVLFFWMTASLAPAHLVGAASRREFAEARPFDAALPVIWADVTARLPSDGRLLLLFEPRGQPFGHSVLQDSQMNNWPLIALAPVDIGCLEGSGITHVLLYVSPLEFRLERGFEESDFEWQAFPEFRERCLTPIYERAGYTLFELRQTGG